MSDLRVVKWLGMICLLAGIARMGMTPAAIIWGTDSVQELSFGYAACILMSAGTIAGFLAQRETGALGFISVLGMTVGNILTTALVFTVFVIEPGSPMPDGPIVALTRIANMAGMILGTILFVIVTFRAKVFPRFVPILFIAMLLSQFLPVEDNVYFALFWGLAYVGMGFCIWTGRLTPRSQTEMPAPRTYSA
ncbi:hypothetical protein D3P08_01810 [Paenibacillus nanensis]|uniref:Uncharacterized protein n=1 Tax=Paenibacillus nanensis TaxID=393251 RepID=A0A3A1VIK2_9BACL|nr:hypothetical protein [Paenibacillus nanensis]RIX60327.1 hypothetical protein D3P08_01810 [Paenibacillus nanensis]